MKKMQIFEPAMCCATGLCGVGVDSELLRISTVLNTLKNNGIDVDRFNLSNFPMEFIKNRVVNEYINQKGPGGLPVIMVDGKIVIQGRYPTNVEFQKLLDLPTSLLEKPQEVCQSKDTPKESGSCGCKGGCCS